MIIRPVYNGIFQKSKGLEIGKGKGEKRATWAHSIVADGWAGASKPLPHPNPQPQTQTYPKTRTQNVVLPLFDSIITNGQTDGRTMPLRVN